MFIPQAAKHTNTTLYISLPVPVQVFYNSTVLFIYCHNCNSQANYYSVKNTKDYEDMKQNNQEHLSVVVKRCTVDGDFALQFSLNKKRK